MALVNEPLGRRPGLVRDVGIVIRAAAFVIRFEESTGRSCPRAEDDEQVGERMGRHSSSKAPLIERSWVPFMGSCGASRAPGIRCATRRTGLLLSWAKQDMQATVSQWRSLHSITSRELATGANPSTEAAC
jgi:hypothetical protein